MAKHIDGDGYIERHVYVGGNADIKGNAVVGHDLKVKGWLDARNIKGAFKGLFESDEQLKECYPEGEFGWYALIGDTLPAELWIWAEDGWKNTGNEAGELDVDLVGIKERIEDHERRLDNLEDNVSDLTEAVLDITTRLPVVESLADTNKKNLDALTTEVNDLAPKIRNYSVQEYWGEHNAPAIRAEKANEDGKVVYIPSLKKFAFLVENVLDKDGKVRDIYYGSWNNCEDYGTLDEAGGKPYGCRIATDRIYLNRIGNALHKVVDGVLMRIASGGGGGDYEEITEEEISQTANEEFNK